MSILQNGESKPWMKFLAWYALVPAIATIALMVSLSSVIVTYGATPVESKMLEGASINLAPIRALGFSQILLWLSIGGLLLSFAAMLKSFAPIRSVFLNAVGIGMTIAGAGGILNIEVTNQMAMVYGNTTGLEQSAIVTINPAVSQIIESHLKTGELLSGIGFLLVYSICVSVPGFPRWLNRWMGLSGLYAMVLIILRLMGIEVPFVAVPIYVIFFALLLYIAIAISMKRRLHAIEQSE